MKTAINDGKMTQSRWSTKDGGNSRFILASVPALIPHGSGGSLGEKVTLRRNQDGGYKTTMVDRCKISEYMF